METTDSLIPPKPAAIAQILSLRERATIGDAWLRDRLDTVIPPLMQREGIDAWVLVAREYNEDPVLATMLPSTWFNARRRTILVFTAAGHQRAAIARYGVGDAFPTEWNPSEQPDQWRALAEHLAAANPQKIAINVSSTFGLADGISASEHRLLIEALGPELRDRVVSNDRLPIGWLETRTDAEMDWYPAIVALSHDIVRRGLTDHIEPSATTTTDLEWWFRQEVLDLGLTTWFQPTVSVQRLGGAPRSSFSNYPDTVAIQQGDLVHVDFGIEYLGLHTDMQQHCYVLNDGEAAPPAGLVDALSVANAVQDVVMANFVAGRTGNEILTASRQEFEDRPTDVSIYSHAIGFHGHAGGPSIGMWDQQDGVPGTGDHPLFARTAYSIELSATTPVAEWDGQAVRIMLEEDAYFDGERCAFMDGRQTTLWTVG